MEATRPKIEALEVTKRFGEQTALASFSIEVAPGEIFGLIGPNGAGKTTFLRILTGYWLPTSGDIRVDGLSVIENPYPVKERMGYAAEQPKLYMDHTVEGFLRLMGEIRGLARDERKERIERMIQRFGLQPLRRRRIAVLSKGFRQRVSLAQALLHSPSLLVIDEPTVGLDPRQQIELREVIQSLRGEYTVVLSTHQLREAAVCCDRVALLDGGKLVQIARTCDLPDTESLEALFLQVTEPREPNS